MTVSLTTVGNSKAVIIPAKILKQSKSSVKRDVVFPKVQIPEISEEGMREFMNSLYRIPEEDMTSDERLQYILSK